MVFRKRPRNQRSSSRTSGVSRLTLLAAFFFIIATAIIARLFVVQVASHDEYLALAQGQRAISEQLTATRGEVFAFDSSAPDGRYPIAANKTYSLVFAVPTRITNPERVAEQLAPILELEEADLLSRLEKDEDLYEPLAHQVPEENVEAIRALTIEGIEFSDESFRAYPEGPTFSHVTGFVGFAGDDRVGQYGIEGHLEETLGGQDGFIRAEEDGSGRLITVGNNFIQEAVNGSDVVLTIDHAVQYYACSRLAEAVARHGANAGSLVITNPSTGGVLALCNFPDFDPNKYNEVTDPTFYVNRAIWGSYEPGSVFKPITMAAGLDRGQVTPETTFVDEGEVQIGSYTIKNAEGKVYGEKTMTQVLEESINTGAIFVANKVGSATFRDYVRAFGFGEQVGIELDGEAAGDVSSLDQLKDIYTATGSYGQGITVTPLQLAAAYAAIANGGTLMKSYLVDRIVRSGGVETVTEPQVVRQVISPETATTLSAMLVRVVEEGHGQRAGVPGYWIAGKTGTAQIPRTDGRGYDPNQTIGTFAGFGPVEDPVFTMVVRIEVPRDVIWAESSAAPLFGDIAKFLLNYYQVPPTREVE